MTHQEREGFGSPFDGPRFSSARTLGHLVEGDDPKEFLKQLGALFFGPGLQ